MAGGPAASGAGIGANAPKNKLSGILMVSFAAFAGILFGYDTGTISGVTAMKDFLRLFGSPTTNIKDHPTGYMITSSQQSLVTSILSAGTFFGERRVLRVIVPVSCAHPLFSRHSRAWVASRSHTRASRPRYHGASPITLPLTRLRSVPH